MNNIVRQRLIVNNFIKLLKNIFKKASLYPILTKFAKSIYNKII